VAYIIAEEFMDYDGEGIIEYIDKNPKNCCLSNLNIIKSINTYTCKKEFKKNKYFIYYKTIYDTYKGLVSDEPNEIIEFALLPTKEYCCFFIQDNYCDENKKVTDEWIYKYHEDFKRSCDELLNEEDEYLKINYKLYSNHYTAIEATFKRWCKGKYEHHEDIGIIESSWIEKCVNCGLIYIKAGKYQSYGYDYKNNYAGVLSSKDFIIPTKAGKEYILNELPKKVKI
jgi:hypothetical protein